MKSTTTMGIIPSFPSFDYYLCHFFQWQLCIDAPEFTDCKTLPIFLHKIELGKWQCCRNIRYFL